MENKELTSRLIASASYDEAAKSILIRMVDGGIRTVKAPRCVYENLITAESPGWYYTRHIRPLFKH